MQPKCTDCGIKKSRFVKEQEAKGLLSNLGIKIPLSKIPHLVSRFACNTRMIVDESSSPPVSLMSNSCHKT